MVSLDYIHIGTTLLDWAYDADGRLIQEKRDVQDDVHGADDYITDFTFDRVGNRLTGDGIVDQTITSEFDANDRLLKDTSASTTGGSNSVTTYTYDANGSTISETRTGAGAQTEILSWDLRNRLKSVTITPNGGSSTTTTISISGKKRRRLFGIVSASIVKFRSVWISVSDVTLPVLQASAVA